MLISILIFIVIGVLVFLVSKSSKKSKKNIIPVDAHNFYLNELLFYKKLNEIEQKRFLNRVELLLNEIYVEAVGFELEDKDRLLVAASGVIPVFCFETWSYPNLSTVLIYPDHFNEDLDFEGENRVIAGMVGTGRYENQMILSRKALHYGFSNKTDKGNTAIHEFIHLIDKMDGDTDGIPKLLLKDYSYTIPWLNMIHTKMEAINKDVSDIRAYGGTSKIEFFAVVSEYFFEQPELLKRNHPKLFRMLQDCFCNV